MQNLDKDVLSYLEWCAEKFLSFRPRAEQELVRYLGQKVRQKYPDFVEAQEDYIATIVDRYKQSNGINDTEFISWWIQERVDFKPKGQRALKQELRQKGISSEMIEEHFSENPIDEDALFNELFTKKARYIDFSIPKNVEKLTQFFLRRGFPYEKVKKAIEDSRKSE